MTALAQRPRPPLRSSRKLEVVAQWCYAGIARRVAAGAVAIDHKAIVLTRAVVLIRDHNDRQERILAQEAGIGAVVDSAPQRPFQAQEGHLGARAPGADVGAAGKGAGDAAVGFLDPLAIETTATAKFSVVPAFGKGNALVEDRNRDGVAHVAPGRGHGDAVVEGLPAGRLVVLDELREAGKVGDEVGLLLVHRAAVVDDKEDVHLFAGRHRRSIGKFVAAAAAAAVSCSHSAALAAVVVTNAAGTGGKRGKGKGGEATGGKGVHGREPS